jgi:hypothetical protein
MSFYGADGAAAHANLTKGIQRALANGEVELIRQKAKQLVDEDATDEGRVAHVARELLPELQRPLSVIHGLLRLAIDEPLHWSAGQWRVPYRGLPYAMLRCQTTGSLIGVSHEWRHTCRIMVRIRTTPHCRVLSGQELIQNAANRTCVQAKHLKDKLDKLIHTVMLPHACPALLADLLLLRLQLGTASGLSGCVLDMSDSSQNNRRAEEMASFTVAHAFLRHMPAALGNAVHVLLAAAHRSLPGHPTHTPHLACTRLAYLSFVHTYLAVNAIALHEGHQPSYKIWHHARAVARHGYTAPTRQIVMSALPAAAGVLHLQYADACAQAGQQPPVVMLSECRSQRCETAFSALRDPCSQQHTGALCCKEILSGMGKYMHLRAEEAAGHVKVPAGRKEARRAISHPADAYRWALADTDMTCALHVGYLLATELLELTGHKPVLRRLVPYLT